MQDAAYKQDDLIGMLRSVCSDPSMAHGASTRIPAFALRSSHIGIVRCPNLCLFSYFRPFMAMRRRRRSDRLRDAKKTLDFCSGINGVSNFLNALVLSSLRPRAILSGAACCHLGVRASDEADRSAARTIEGLRFAAKSSLRACFRIGIANLRRIRGDRGDVTTAM